MKCKHAKSGNLSIHTSSIIRHFLRAQQIIPPENPTCVSLFWSALLYVYTVIALTLNMSGKKKKKNMCSAEISLVLYLNSKTNREISGCVCLYICMCARIMCLQFVRLELVSGMRGGRPRRCFFLRLSLQFFLNEEESAGWLQHALF